ncbi:MAG: site-2 protease family protein [Candidatus Micrarchaeaceae archaeon]
MAFAYREHISVLAEIKEIAIADIVLIIAFSSTLAGGALFSNGNFLSQFIYFVPISAIAVTLSFVLHELMHKFVAQHYGAVASFRTSLNGLLITLATGLMGFLLGIPGATYIYTNSFTKEEDGKVSLAGPLTNFAIFGIFAVAIFALNPAPNSYLANVISFTISVSILLAFFNMLPIFPLDGSKVFAWNKGIYLITMGIIFVLLYLFTDIPLLNIAYFILIAFIFSIFYRGFRF